jgi:hypothetical protein
MKKIIDKLEKWTHDDSLDQSQINNRAMLVAGLPIMIGFLIGLIIYGILKLLGV